LLNDPTESIRDCAATALGKIGDVQAVEGLLELLNDSNGYVRQNATDALNQIGGESAIKGLLEYQNSSTPSAHSRTTIGDREKMDILSDPNEHMHNSSTDLLWNIGNRKSVQELLKALGDENISVRRIAIKELGEIGDAQSVEDLLKMLNDPVISVRRQALDALEEIDNEDVLRLVAAWEQENGSYVRNIGIDAYDETPLLGNGEQHEYDTDDDL
jgi:HEAT repeat protein